ncbi:His/Gly/Thr/Pro-type tRNA ligase C-terminal domain-containing protein [Streptomyces mirabilis]|uniref:His/Gly/Thr/Pro-type tRNA ligase C-terminal domain-containing protein n=1 Tax=Streptomyces mirabilis TaxID=68239 RepID=UPI002252E442|nr:His/Gly/Thr/Pro-type tRNA ligase C-terminal domain-containing protein [Streptomyces mirabilis]MCX4426075.1 His/Gly/Thr/Pro-type tRNA ligase C-terminal domain-containing protein [Streptomyces mirabilis]
MGFTVADAQGASAPAHMACSGIGITRCLQTLADLHRDHHGLCWKPGCGPADLHLIVVRADLPEMRERTEQIVRQLQQHGARLLVDDGPEAAGEKFAYARLVGVPHVLVISPQQTDGTVEFIDRWTSRHQEVPLSHIPGTPSLQPPADKLRGQIDFRVMPPDRVLGGIKIRTPENNSAPHQKPTEEVTEICRQLHALH